MHFSADLPKLLLINSRQGERRLILLNASLGRHPLRLRFDSFRQREFDRVRIAERENDLLSLDISFVTNSDNIHLLGKAFGDADNRVVRERASQSVQCRLLYGGPLSD